MTHDTHKALLPGHGWAVPGGRLFHYVYGTAQHLNGHRVAAWLPLGYRLVTA